MRDLLLNLAETDRRLTRQLGDSHPRVLELREANARELELIVDEDGWPTPEESGEDGAQAALHIALNATARPAFQRRCLTMMLSAAHRGELPMDHAAAMEGVIAH